MLQIVSASLVSTQLPAINRGILLAVLFDINAEHKRKGLHIMIRPSGRRPDQLRKIELQRGFTNQAEGSVLVSFGNTRVICTASVERGVPRFMRGQGRGWITAEYGMLPRSTGERMGREATRGKQGGRTVEIQRLIGRSLRAAIDMDKLGEHTITVDCDVIQADGGTRTASITGACVAVADAIAYMLEQKWLEQDPIKNMIASVSVGMYQGVAVLDLDYPEDSNADTDMNVIMDAAGGFVEVQGTAEGETFAREELNSMLALAERGIGELIHYQREALAKELADR